MRNLKRLFILVLGVILLCVLSGCGFDHVNQQNPSSMVAATVATDDAATTPLATQLPTVPASSAVPEPTIPPLGAGPGSHILSYYSTQYDDYLDYYIHVPLEAAAGMPLVVFLHGDGEVNNIDLIPQGGISSIVDELYGQYFPFVLLEPNTRIESWTKGNIPELLFELINAVACEYDVDYDRIILTGFSRGAIGVWDMISIYGGFFSAAVPVSSPHQKGHIDYIKAAEVPVWTFAGNIGETERWYHQYLAQNVDIINGCDGFGKFTILNGCNHSQAKYAAYVQETFDWMLAQRRGVIPEE